MPPARPAKAYYVAAFALGALLALLIAKPARAAGNAPTERSAARQIVQN